MKVLLGADDHRPARAICLLASAALVLAACRDTSRPPPTADESAAQPEQHGQRRFTSCAMPTQAGGEQQAPVTIAGVRLVQQGDQLMPSASPSAAGDNDKAPSSSDTLVLGVLADTRRATPSTLAHLAQLDLAFERAGVHAVVMLGGIDPTFEGARQVLGRLGASRPLLALPGDSGSRDGFRAAMREAGAQAVDLTLVHLVRLPQATLAAVPGYFLPHHLAAGQQGCGYSAADLRYLSRALKEHHEPRIVLAHAPPRGNGPAAVDRSFGGLNIGDPQINDLINAAGARAGFVAHVHEAAGHATTLDERRVAAGVWSDTLLLNVGSADTAAHEHLDRRWSGPTAAIVEIRAGRLRYRMIDEPTTDLPRH